MSEHRARSFPGAGIVTTNDNSSIFTNLSIYCFLKMEVHLNVHMNLPVA
jgi:hypothetical protein